jgi:DNA-binding PucR family transcriptional regulator
MPTPQDLLDPAVVAETWEPPSEPAAALIREAARWFLAHSDELAATLDAATAAATPSPLQDDPVLAAEAAASTRANLLHWAGHTLADPGGRVPVNLSADVLAIARDAIRRGADQLLVSGYHASQNIAWRYCMRLLFALGDDSQTLAEALDVAARSIFQFVDDTVAALERQVELERSELTRGTHAERLEVVNLILEGAPITAANASARLGYDLARGHTAAIVWGDPVSADQAQLDGAAEALARAGGGGRPLTVIASSSSLWVWFATERDVDADAAGAAIDGVPAVRAALGRVGAGVDGFRRSHLDALATQRLMHALSADLRVATFDDVQLVALATADAERASEFVARTLGGLATAEPELRETVRTYIREQFSASRAARTLFAHRNTILGRLRRAEQLLPAPLDGRGLEVGLALEIVHWRAAGAGN